MILENETQVQLGYNVSSLTNGSSKKVIVQCDYCGVHVKKAYKAYLLGQKKHPRDACNKCRVKKREEMSVEKYGCKNPFQREDVKQKIRNNYGGKWHTQTEEFKEKAKKTMIEKYGVESAMHNEELKNKHKQTILDKYGVESVSQILAVKEKVKETCQEKYGADSFLGSDIGKNTSIQKIKEKYGVDNVFSSEEIKQKIKETNLEKYGVEYPSQLPEIQEKAKKTNLERYGSENVMDCKDIRKRIETTNLDRYGVKHPTKNKNVKNKIKQSMIDSGFALSYMGKTMKEWSKELGKPYTTLVVQARRWGLKEAIDIPTHVNELEHVVKTWLDKEQIPYTHNAVIEGRKSDFLLPNKIVIECDGLYWHSDKILDDNYHVIKMQHYTDNGYTPLFFRSNEIYDSFDIIKSIILNKLGQSKRIFARKCIIEEIIPEFFQVNHLMGKGRGKCYGLIYEGEVVCGLQVLVKSDNMEVSRFCPKLGHQIVGGFSKLLKFAEEVNRDNIDNVFTFIDKRYGKGDYLESLGFKYKKCYPSFRWTDGHQIFHRMKFKGNSGYDQGLAKIWDCGQARWKKRV